MKNDNRIKHVPSGSSSHSWLEYPPFFLRKYIDSIRVQPFQLSAMLDYLKPHLPGIQVTYAKLAARHARAITCQQAIATQKALWHIRAAKHLRISSPGTWRNRTSSREDCNMQLARHTFCTSNNVNQFKPSYVNTTVWFVRPWRHMYIYIYIYIHLCV